MSLDSGAVERMRRVLRHRMLNIVAGIKSANNLLGSELDARLAPREREYFPLIQKECDKVCVIMDRIEALLGPLPRQDPMNLDLVVSSIMAELRSNLPVAEIVLNVEVVDPTRKICRNALGCALFEAVDNAHGISRKKVAVVLSDFSGDACLARVVNQGEALTEDVCRMAFEPFYTTRTRHVGVGLSIARRNVESVGGSVSIGTGPDGNFVEFVLPYM